MNGIAKAKLSMIKEYLDDIHRKVEATKEKISFQNKYIEKIKSQSEESESKVKTQIEEHLTLITESEKSIETLSENFEKPEEVRDKTLAIRSEISKMNSIRDQIKSNIVNSQKEIDFYEDNDSCPVCKQGIDKNFCDEKLETAGKKKVELEEGLELLIKKVSQKEYSLKESDNKYKASLNIEKEMSNHKSLIDSSKKQVEKLKKEIETHRQYDEELQTEMQTLSRLEGELLTYEENLKEKEKEILNYKICISLLKDNGIKAKIIKHYLPVVNRVISKFLKSMNFFTQFELDEEFNETIKSRFRDKFSYMSFSEGEKLRIDLALLFAW